MSEQSKAIRKKWDNKHAEAEGVGEVARVLSENRHLLPQRGDALDLACGRGANALELARCGLNVRAWDVSTVALERLNDAADRCNFHIDTEVRDLRVMPPPAISFDVIVVSHFLDRSLAGAIQNAIRPGGLLYYQTFNATSTTGPITKSFHLRENELLTLFPGLKLRVYREECSLGDEALRWRGLSMMVAER